MVDGVDLQVELLQIQERYWECVSRISELRKAHADAERTYRIAKQQRISYERNHNGTPASLCNDIVKGMKDIADLKHAMDVAEGYCEQNKEEIMFWKRQEDALREQMQREWTLAGRF